MSLNHVNMDKLKELMEATKENLANAKITPRVIGDWRPSPPEPRSQSTSRS